jgi:hypothetical protein
LLGEISFINEPTSSVSASPGEVTAEWLQCKLTPKFIGQVVESVMSERLGEGYGLTSRIFTDLRPKLFGSYRLLR